MPEFHNPAGCIQCNRALLPCSVEPTSALCYKTLTDWELWVHHPCGKNRFIECLLEEVRDEEISVIWKRCSILRILRYVFKASIKRYLTCEALLSLGEKCFKWQQHSSDTIQIACMVGHKHVVTSNHWCGVFPQKVLLKEVPIPYHLKIMMPQCHFTGIF